MKKINLYKAQKVIYDRAIKSPVFANFSDQGTGKTIVALKLIEYRMKNNGVNHVVIILPQTIIANWIDEIKTYLDVVVNVYDTNHDKVTSEILKSDKKSITLINYEKYIRSYYQLKKKNFDMAVIDESHRLKNYKIRKAKTCSHIYYCTRNILYKLIMTGTPICNGAEDLFMQFKILDEKIICATFDEFQSMYLKMGGYFNKNVIGYKNQKKLQKIVQKHSARVELKDCVELPPIVINNVYTKLSPPALRLYGTMEKSLYAELDKVKAKLSRLQLKTLCRNSGIHIKRGISYLDLFILCHDLLSESNCDMLITKLLRMHQIAGGFLTTDAGTTEKIHNVKINACLDLLEGIKGQVLIFCQYKAEIEHLEIALKKSKYKVCNYREQKTRTEVYRDFKEGRYQIMILQISSGSVGLNLQEANHVIFYSWNYKADSYRQAISRIKRIGQSKKMYVQNIIMNGTIDKTILNIIGKKSKFAAKFLARKKVKKC